MSTTNDGMDYLGHLVIDPGENEIHIPMDRGTEITNPAVTRNLPLAGHSMFAPRNWVQGLRTPAIIVRTPVFGGLTGWLSAARLKAYFGLPFGDATNRPAETGIIPAGPPIQVRYANTDPVEWPGHYLDRIMIEASRVGNYLDATLMFLPAGLPVYGEDVTELGTGKPPYGSPYMFQGISLTGLEGISRVSWMLANNFTADDSSDSSTKAGDGHYYPATYFPSQLTGGVELEYKTSAVIDGDIIAPAPDATSLLTMAVSNPGGTGTVTFVSPVKQGQDSRTVQFDVGKERKQYDMTDTAANALVAIS